jgi:hypothetical protein
MSELKPCPFCGKEMSNDNFFSCDGYPQACGCWEHTHTGDEAINVWNTRPVEDKLQSRINKACEMALLEMGVYADAEFKDLPDQLMVFRNIIDVLQGKGE